MPMVFVVLQPGLQRQVFYETFYYDERLGTPGLPRGNHKVVLIASDVSLFDPSNATMIIEEILDREQNVADDVLVFSVSEIFTGQIILPDQLGLMTQAQQTDDGINMVAHGYVMNANQIIQSRVFLENRQAVIQAIRRLANEYRITLNLHINEPEVRENHAMNDEDVRPRPSIIFRIISVIRNFLG